MARGSGFKLRVEPPRAGWTQTTIVLDAFEISIPVSDVAVDSFGELASLALSTLRGEYRAGPARFWLEPGGYILSVEQRAGDAVELCLSATDELLVGAPKVRPVARAQMSGRGFALAVWRSLRGAERTLRAGHRATPWKHDFPAREVQALGAALE